MICSSDSFVLLTSFVLAWQLQNFVTVGPRQTTDGGPIRTEEYEAATRRRDLQRAEPLYPEIPSLESPFDNYKVGRGDTTLIGISDGWLDKMTIPMEKEAPTTLAFSPDPIDQLEGDHSSRSRRYVNDTTSNSGDENSRLREASANVDGLEEELATTHPTNIRTPGHPEKNLTNESCEERKDNQHYDPLALSDVPFGLAAWH